MNKNYNNIELEKMILAACIVNNDNLLKLIERNVSKEDFYFKNHKLIYEAMIKNLQEYRTTELNALRMQLNGKADVESIRKVINENAIVDINNPIYIDNFLDLSKKRKYIQMLREIQNLETDDIEKYITEQVNQINKSKKSNNNFITLDKVSSNNFYEVDKIKTGLIDLDKKINGFVEGSLVVLTGYSGNGKSTLINQMCIAESILQGKKVFVYSPELTNSMFKDWLYTTLANNDDFVEYEDKIILNNKNKNQIDNWIKEKLYVYDDNKITFSPKQLLKDMEYLASVCGVKVFVIDNLMKINLEDVAKNEFVAQKLFVNQLKEFARKYGVVVHLVAHLKKPSETNKIITKFEVNGSIDITNIADYIISVSKVSKAQRKKDSILKDCVLKVMKDRLTGNDEVFVNLSFDKVRKRFYGYDEELNKNYIA